MRSSWFVIFRKDHSLSGHSDRQGGRRDSRHLGTIWAARPRQLGGPAAEAHPSGRGTDHRTGRPSHTIDANPVCQAGGGDPGWRRQRTPLNSDMTPEQTLTEMARLVDTGADRLNSLQTTAHRTDQPYPRLSISVASRKRCCFIRISAPMLQFAVEGARFQP